MGKWIKRLLLLLVLVVCLPLVAAAGVTAVAYTAGTVTVEVEDVEGYNFTVPLPAGIVPVALRFVPREVTSEMCEEMAREVGPQWAAVRAAFDELERIPDGVLVSVESGRDQVRISKQDDEIVVQVRPDGEGMVRVSAPVGTLGYAASALERTCGG